MGSAVHEVHGVKNVAEIRGLSSRMIQISFVRSKLGNRVKGRSKDSADHGP
jgi:hypothetical protein